MGATRISSISFSLGSLCLLSLQKKIREKNRTDKGAITSKLKHLAQAVEQQRNADLHRIQQRIDALSESSLLQEQQVCFV